MGFGSDFELKANEPGAAATPLITTRDVTKIAPATHAVTSFPLVLNEIRSVTAFTPIFRSNVLVNKPFPTVLLLLFGHCNLFPLPCNLRGFRREKRDSVGFRRIPSGADSIFSTTSTERRNHPHILEYGYNQRWLWVACDLELAAGSW